MPFTIATYTPSYAGHALFHMSQTCACLRYTKNVVVYEHDIKTGQQSSALLGKEVFIMNYKYKVRLI